LVHPGTRKLNPPYVARMVVSSPEFRVFFFFFFPKKGETSPFFKASAHGAESGHVFTATGFSANRRASPLFPTGCPESLPSPPPRNPDKFSPPRWKVDALSKKITRNSSQPFFPPPLSFLVNLSKLSRFRWERNLEIGKPPFLFRLPFFFRGF